MLKTPRLTFSLWIVIALFPFIGTANADSYFMRDYAPMAVSNHWYYDFGGPAQNEAWISGFININNYSAWAMNYTGGGLEYYSADGDGILLHSSRLNGAVYLLSHPLRVFPSIVSPGGVYSDQTTFVAADGKTYDYLITTEVLGTEEVVLSNQVTLKNTLKVRITTRIRSVQTGYDSSQTMMNWYCRNLGIVQTTDLATQATGKLTQGITFYPSGNKQSELTSSPDLEGYVYFEYRDETMERASRKQKADGSYILIDEYHSAPNLAQVKTVRYFSNTDVLELTLVYYASGQVLARLIPDIASYEYYEDGAIKSLCLISTDNFAPNFYQYNNGTYAGEPWNVRYPTGYDFILSSYMPNPNAPMMKSLYISGLDIVWSKSYDYATRAINRLQLFRGCVIEMRPLAPGVILNVDPGSRLIINPNLENPEDYVMYEYWAGTMVFKRSILWDANDRPKAIQTYDALGRLLFTEFANRTYETYEYWNPASMVRKKLTAYNPGGIELKVFEYNTDGVLRNISLTYGGTAKLNESGPFDSISIEHPGSQLTLGAVVAVQNLSLDQQASFHAGDVHAGNVTVQNGSVMAADSIVADSLVIGPGSSVTINEIATGALTLNSDQNLTLNAADRINGPTTVQNGTLTVTNANNLGSGQSLTIGLGATVVLSAGLSQAVHVGSLSIAGIPPAPQQASPAAQTVLPSDLQSRLEMFRKMREERLNLSRAPMVTGSTSFADTAGR